MIAKEWELVKLSDVTKINMGQSPLSSDCNEKGEGLPFFQGNADFGFINPLPTKHCTRPKKIANSGDILISVRAPVGEVNIAYEKSAIGRGVSAITPTNVSKLFLYYFLNYFKPQWVNLQQGSTFTAINKGDLVNLLIPNPPEFEQKKIAAILSSVDDAIEKTEAIIEQTEKVKKGLIQQLLTKGIGHSKFRETEIGEIPEEWKLAQIKECLTEYCGGASLSPKDFTGEGVKILPKKGVTPRGIVEIPDKEITFTSEEFAEKNRRSLVDDTFLITVLRDLVPSGPSIGRICNLKNGENFLLAQGVYGFKIQEDKLDKQYLVYLSNSTYFRNEMKRKLVGSTQVHLRTNDFFNTPIPLPTINEQRRIVDILESIDNKLQSEKIKKSTLTIIKKGLMQDLLTGKVRVNVDEEEVVSS